MPFAPRVLVVDDEEIVLDVLAKLLERHKIERSEARTGTEALAMIRQGGFGCLLTDKNLPDVDGLTLLDAVRESQPYCACIVMTGYPSTESAVEALRLGAVEYLLKPFDDLGAVARKIGSALAAQRARFERDEALRLARQHADALVALAQGEDRERLVKELETHRQLLKEI